MSKLKKTLTKDAGLKLLSLIIAVCLWFLVINIENPTEYRIFASNIDVINISSAEAAGKTITNLEEIKNTRISVRLRGKRTVLDKIQINRSFSAYIDISAIDMSDDLISAKLPVKIKTGLLASDYVDTEFLTTSEVNVLLDNNISMDFDIMPVFNGNIENGVTLSVYNMEPGIVKVYGAQNEVNKIAEVRADIKLDSPYDGQKVTSAVNAYDFEGNIVENVYIDTETTVATIDMKIKKRVPVMASYIGEPVRGCTVEGISISPDYVVITGSPDVINDVSYVTLPEININLSSKDVVQNFDISQYLPYGASVTNGYSGVVVTVNIEGSEEHNVIFNSGNIEITNLEDTLRANIVDGSFDIYVKGDNFNKENLKYSVDLKGLDVGEHRVKIDIGLNEGYELVGEAPYANVVIEPNNSSNNFGRIENIGDDLN